MSSLATVLLTAVSLATQQADLAPESPPGNLVSGTHIEGLSEVARIVMATNYALNVDPGVCARKNSDSVVLSTYDGAKIRATFGADRMTFASPVIARLTPDGWDLGVGQICAIKELHLSRAPQDDTDSNLKSMQESAKKIKSNNGDNVPVKKLKVRWLYGENPNATAALFNTPAIQQLTHFSPIGF